MSSKRISCVVVVALLGSACGGWQRLDDLTPDTLPQRQQVQVWSAGKARVLHAVRIGGDSITGVPFQLSPTCDSCRVAIPRADVDSLRVGDQEAPAIITIGLGIALFLALVASLAGFGEGT